MPQAGLPTTLQRWYIDPATGAGILGLTPTCQVGTAPIPAVGSVPSLALVVVEVGSGLYAATHTFSAQGVFAAQWSAAGGLDPVLEFVEVEGSVAVVVLPGAASYSGDPSASDLDWIRFTIGDTGPSYGGDQWHFMDSEITGILAVVLDRVRAAIQLLYAWARQIGHNPNFNIGRFGEDWDKAAKFLQEKAQELERTLAAGAFGVYVGGVGVADKAAKEGDTDRTSSAVKRGFLSNPEAGW